GNGHSEDLQDPQPPDDEDEVVRGDRQEGEPEPPEARVGEQRPGGSPFVPNRVRAEAEDDDTDADLETEPQPAVLLEQRDEPAYPRREPHRLTITRSQGQLDESADQQPVARSAKVHFTHVDA